jgi:AcrR family transcriptional regulator
MKMKAEKRGSARKDGAQRGARGADVLPDRSGRPVRPDRRQHILDATQRLFARFGYHGVTIRQIAAEARVPLALVGYYFGSKQQLYDAVFGHSSGLLGERSLALQAALAETNGERLPRIVAAMVSPVVRMRASVEGETYAVFIAQGLSHQGAEEDAAIRQYFDPLATEFIDALHAELARHHPAFTRAQAAWGFQFALGALLHYLRDQRVARLSGGANVVADPAVEPQLIAFIACGLRGLAGSFSGKGG